MYENLFVMNITKTRVFYYTQPLEYSEKVNPECTISLRIEFPMTFCTQGCFPTVFYILGMDKFHRFIHVCILHIPGRALGDECMAQVTIFRNNSPLIAFMLIRMAAKTSIRFNMTDMVQIFIRRHFHVWENIQ